MTRSFNSVAMVFIGLMMSAAVLTEASRDLMASSTCVVSTSVKGVSINQITCKSAYKEAFEACQLKFCKDPNSPVEPHYELTVQAKATAIARAVATGAAQVCATGTISPSCEPGSYSLFKADVRAKAVAQAVAHSFAAAQASIIGEAAWKAVGADIIAISNALATTCETRYVRLLTPYMLCEKTSCTSSSCGIVCHYWNERCVTATARAVAKAIAEAQAVVDTYYNTGTCDKPCEIALCGFVCPDGC